MTQSFQRAISSDLEATLTTAGFIAPSYHDPSIGSVLPAAAAALGHGHALDSVAATTGGQARANLAAQTLGLGQVDRVCVVLIDGMGWHNLADNASFAPFLTGLMGQSTPGRSGFPSTTAASMGTFGTGSSTGQTTMVGYSALDPVSGELGNFVSWRNLPDPHTVQRHPGIFGLLEKHGVRVSSVGLERFAQSGMTQAALRTANFKGAAKLSEHVDIASAQLNHPGLVHLYWGELDRVGHHAGVESSAWRNELAHVDYEISRLYSQLPPGTALVVTADHGMIDTDPSALIDISDHYDLSKGVRAVGGEPRASHVYLNSPNSAAATAQRWQSVLQDRAVVLTKDYAVSEGLFGTTSKHTRKWLGDLIVLMTGTGTIADSTTAARPSLKLIGVHGSLTPAEVEIPILAAHT